MDQNTDKTKKLESSYDENPYISKTYYHTQPEKLKSNLRLLDFISPNLKNAKVLEIGCSFGGNIIPFAIEPASSFPVISLTFFSGVFIAKKLFFSLYGFFSEMQFFVDFFRFFYIISEIYFVNIFYDSRKRKSSRRNYF